MARRASKINDEVATSFTSMIDVVFLLVIFFILQPFKSPEMRLRAELPRGEASPNVGPTVMPITLRVLVSPEGGKRAFWMVNRVRIDDRNRIGNELWTQAVGDRDVPVSIASDPTVPFQYVLSALDECARVGMTKIAFAAGQ